MAPVKPLALIILDGWGLRDTKRGNAVAQAATPNFMRYQENYPHTTLQASGEVVGLPEGQMGNSEVGHLNMGAGRVVYQDLSRITKAIRDKSFFETPYLVDAVKHAKVNNKALHIMGLTSDGGVHSHIDHLYAVIDLAKEQGLSEVYIHCFLDGRDVPPANAKEYIQPLEQKLQQVGFGKIATVMGRYYAMDRDRRWERVETAYLAMVEGKGIQVESAREAVENAYERKETDEFVQPTVIIENGNPVATVEDGDSIIFINFRPDRAREITRSFVDKEFDGFTRARQPKTFYVCMTEYDRTIEAHIAFGPEDINNTLGEVLAKNDKKQLRIAETEKYAHVTFFFNGGVETPNVGEDRKLIPSPKVATYDLQPEMSAYEVTEALLEEIEQDKYDVIILNYANPDMVGHTGDMDAAVKAVETVDQCLEKVVEAILKKDGVALITSDHGNAEMMKDDAGNPVTAHSTNCVPFMLVSEQHRNSRLVSGSLADVAPTILSLLEIKKPYEMSGHSLIGD